jgi:hypothetical protein
MNGDLPFSIQRYVLPALTGNTNANQINGRFTRALPARPA